MIRIGYRLINDENDDVDDDDDDDDHDSNDDDDDDDFRRNWTHTLNCFQ